MLINYLHFSLLHILQIALILFEFLKEYFVFINHAIAFKCAFQNSISENFNVLQNYICKFIDITLALLSLNNNVY